MLQKINNTIFEMFEDRKYIITEFNYDNIFHLAKKHNGENIHTHILEETKIGIKLIKDIIDQAYKDKVNHIIIVCPVDITSFAKQHINTNDIKIEIFFYNELYFNITKHELVPKHELLSETEIYRLLEKFKVCKKNLPRILLNDPISRYYGACIGQIFKITRENEIYYRLVI